MFARFKKDKGDDAAVKGPPPPPAAALPAHMRTDLAPSNLRPPSAMTHVVSASDDDGDEEEMVSMSPGGLPKPGGNHYENDSFGDSKPRKEHKPASLWVGRALLILAIIAVVFAIIGAISSGSILGAKMTEQAAQLGADKDFDGYGEDETWYAGGYTGWEYKSWIGNYVNGMTDIHASPGDTVIFRARDLSTSNDLYLVPQEVWESCNFSNFTDEWDIMTNESQLWLADMVDLSSEEGYEFEIEDFAMYDYDDEFYDYLVKQPILYFASSYNWDRTWSQACKYGTKLRVFIEDARNGMGVIESNNEWLNFADSTTVRNLGAAIGLTARQLVLSQFNAEQRVRGEGDSGLTTVRGYYDGDAAYDDGTFSNGAAASIHNHADHIRVVGIGEIAAVLNGVEFQTRHNDYNLNMPHRTDGTYGWTEPIYEAIFEDTDSVPPSVTGKSSVSGQIAEMQEYFRAFKTQNTSHRDYTPYFKPIMCYVEGTWITDAGSLDEPFDSDRHEIDARTWKQLHDKIRWMSNSGRKNSAENLAHLPSAIRNLWNNTYPITANWEYRVLCAPLANDIPTSRFEIADDLHVQLGGSPKTREELYYDRRARFKLNTYINTGDLDDHRWSAGQRRWNYLDYLMEQIPGKDNYIANISDFLPDGTEGVIHYMTDELTNSGYYSRYYGLTGADAMGSTKHRRGWHDRYLFAAKTTQDKVSPVEFNYEMEDGSYYPTISRWSYAFPLEIIYLTPLSSWNPYNIEKLESMPSGSGSCPDSGNNPYSGWYDNFAFFTPSAFFTGLDAQEQADTSGDETCMLDSDGNTRYVRASGHWITFPEIDNVGYVRQRYPIFPIHEAGESVWKEVKALQDIILPDDYDDIYTGVDFFGSDRDLKYGFIVYLQGNGHQHAVYIPGWKVTNYWYDDTNEVFYNGSAYTIEEDSDEREGHSHTVKIWRWRDDASDSNWNYVVDECRYGTLSDEGIEDTDWEDDQCDDGHGSILRT